MENTLSSMMLSPLHRFTLGLGSITDRTSSKDKRKQFLLSTSLRSTSCQTAKFKQSPPNQQFSKLYQSRRLINKSIPPLHSVIISNKSKLSAFNSLIDDIFNSNQDSSITNDKLGTMRNSHSSLIAKPLKSFLHFSPQGNPKSTELSRPFDEEKRVKKHSSLVKSPLYYNPPRKSLSRSLVSGTGIMIKDFSSFKSELNKTKTKMTNLINNIKRAQAMNETWLKSYVVRLKSRESKYFNMPKIEFDNYDL